MRLITFYAEANLPEAAHQKQKGFDWRWAIGALTASATRWGMHVDVVTDNHTLFASEPWMRVGDAKKQGIMLWLLDAQKAAVQATKEPIVLISPDTLITAPLKFLEGPWDMAMLTRRRPKPIVNSVIYVRPGKKVSEAWERVLYRAHRLPVASREWGADIDALVHEFRVRPSENGLRELNGVKLKLIPIEGKFVSVPLGVAASPIKAPIIDFKGARKASMPNYAKLFDGPVF